MAATLVSSPLQLETLADCFTTVVHGVLKAVSQSKILLQELSMTWDETTSEAVVDTSRQLVTMY